MRFLRASDLHIDSPLRGLDRYEGAGRTAAHRDAGRAGTAGRYGDRRARFLHASDLHLDSPLRGLDRYEGAPVARLRTATRAALERLVNMAIAERINFVLFAGDIYDRDWQDFHTAEGGQVMIFTHHRHLVDLALAALGDQALAVHSL